MEEESIAKQSEDFSVRVRRALDSFPRGLGKLALGFVACMAVYFCVVKFLVDPSESQQLLEVQGFFLVPPLYFASYAPWLLLTSLLLSGRRRFGVLPGLLSGAVLGTLFAVLGVLGHLETLWPF